MTITELKEMHPELRGADLPEIERFLWLTYERPMVDEIKSIKNAILDQQLELADIRLRNGGLGRIIDTALADLKLIHPKPTADN